MFRIGIDGIILSQSAELIYPVDEAILHDCAPSYRRCLEDLAFAIVYAEKILKNPFLRPTDDPQTFSAPHLLREIELRDQSILGELPVDPDIHGDQLLVIQDYRKEISKDLRLLEECVRTKPDQERFKEWLVREATLYFGKRPSVFEEKADPSEYEYGTKEGHGYHTNRELQSSISADVISILDAELPTSPRGQRDLYSHGARVEFITRNMLSLVTIMRSFDLSASRHDLWRLPHVTRACIGLQRLRNAGHQLRLRHVVVRHALYHALRDTPNDSPESLITNLCDLRQAPGIRVIREMLLSSGLFARGDDKAMEEAARQFNMNIQQISPSSISESDSVVLAKHSALRQFREVDQREYEKQLYDVFPQLKPGRGREFFDVSPSAGSTFNGDQIINYGSVGAVGRGAQGVVNINDCWARIGGEINLQVLAVQLETLRSECERRAASRDDAKQLSLLVEAAEAAERGDGYHVASVLGRVSKSVLDAAKDIGTDVAAKVIAEMLKG